MSFVDWIQGLFGKKPAVKPDVKSAQTAQNATVTRSKNRQVYEGRPVDAPEWAANLSISDLVAEVQKHVVCKYMPKFELKRIMSAQRGADGNLIPEYNGVAGDCGAIKQQGRKVAEQNGLTMPYRYVDLNIAYRACCGNPQKCPFFLHAEGDMESVNSRRR